MLYVTVRLCFHALLQTRESDDGKGTYREMTLNGAVISENIYLNRDALEVTFVKSDGQGEVNDPPPPFPAIRRLLCRFLTSHLPINVHHLPHARSCTQHYNTVLTDPVTHLRVLKFGLRDITTKEPLHWHAPAAVAQGGISKVFERALQLQSSSGAAAAP